MALSYVWDRYSLKVVYDADSEPRSKITSYPGRNYWGGTNYSFDRSTGIFTITAGIQGFYVPATGTATMPTSGILYLLCGEQNQSTELLKAGNSGANWYFIGHGNTQSEVRMEDGSGYTAYRSTAKTVQGDYIGTVSSSSRDTYPENGISGNYYYVFKHVVTSVPAITVPGAAMIGQTVDISWEAADSAESYKLERRVDSGGWTQVYEGAGLTYADTVQVEWSNVQYRVSASISGVYGDPILSKTVNIVPSTTLRISMPEGNIGEIKGAITYTALSDAPRDAIYISEVFENTYSDYQRELTLKPGDSVTIPVSRFPSAAGGRFTVKAKVQISDNAWANENRQLSYTKTPTSMPDSPYRVERLQGKECDVMPQTLAEAVFMPDGKSVAAYMDFIKTRATVVTGSYVGTGDYNSGTGWGSSNPTSLTFDFAPKLLIIGWQETLDNGFFTSNLGERVTSDNYYSIYTGALTTQFKQYRGFGDPSGSYAKRPSDGKTITWYATGHANAQRNDRRYKYYYLAIG